jgi:hypothetical protein
MDRTATYRRYAAGSLALAKKARDPIRRRLFLEMSASWHELATLAKNCAKEPLEQALRPVTE